RPAAVAWLLKLAWSLAMALAFPPSAVGGLESSTNQRWGVSSTIPPARSAARTSVEAARAPAATDKRIRKAVSLEDFMDPSLVDCWIFARASLDVVTRVAANLSTSRGKPQMPGMELHPFHEV